jgi:hypothetical protein
MALSDWDHDRIVQVTLPHSKREVPFELPDLQLFMARGFIPNPLAAMAAKVEFEGITMEGYETMDDGSREELFDLMCWIVAHGLHAADAFPGEDEDAVRHMVTVTMHPDDRFALWMKAMHVGLVDFTEGVRASLETVASFRSIEGGPPVPSDDAGNREVTV